MFDRLGRVRNLRLQRTFLPCEVSCAAPGRTPYINAGGGILMFEACFIPWGMQEDIRGILAPTSPTGGIRLEPGRYEVTVEVKARGFPTERALYHVDTDPEKGGYGASLIRSGTIEAG